MACRGDCRWLNRRRGFFALEPQILCARVARQFAVCYGIEAIYRFTADRNNRPIRHRRQRLCGCSRLFAQFQAAARRHDGIARVVIWLYGLDRFGCRRRRLHRGRRRRCQRLIRHIDVIALHIARKRTQQHRQHAVIPNLAGHSQHRSLRKRHDDARIFICRRTQIQSRRR